MVKWMSSYLEDRTQIVVIEGKCSIEWKPGIGILQGGNMSPSLWREFAQDIIESIYWVSERKLNWEEMEEKNCKC